MSRPDERAEVEAAVRAYLAAAEEQFPSVKPINVSAVARATEFHRNTLINHGLNAQIREAAERQKEFAKSGAAKRQATRNAAWEKANEEVKELRSHVASLQARIHLAEGNARRLGINPAELWHRLEAPPRDVPSG